MPPDRLGGMIISFRDGWLREFFVNEQVEEKSRPIWKTAGSARSDDRRRNQRTRFEMRRPQQTISRRCGPLEDIHY